MEVSSAAKVGMVTVLGLIILALAYTWIQGTKTYAGKRYVIVFARVEGITEGSPVRIAGVQVGKVASLEIVGSREVNVTIAILPKFSYVTLTKESIYTIGQSFVGERWIEVQPMPGEAVAENGRVQGVPPVTFDELMAKAEGTLNRVDQSMQGLSKFVDDPEFQTNIKQTVTNFNRLSRQFQGTARDISHLVNGVNGKLDTLTNNANALLTNINSQISALGGNMQQVTSTLNRVAVHSESDINHILNNVRQATESLKSSMASVQRLVGRKEYAEELQATLTNVRKSTEDLEGILSDVRLVTSNPKTQAAINDTFQQAHDTIQNAREAMEKINQQLDKWGIGGKGKGKPGGLPSRFYEMDLESEWNLNNGNQSTNLNLFLLPRGPLFGLEAGVDSLGNQNLVNFEFAHPGGNMRQRAGVIRGQFGLGVDDFLNDNSWLSLDVYDPHLPQVDLLGRFGSKDYFLMGGVRDILHGSHPVMGVGKRF